MPTTSHLMLNTVGTFGAAWVALRGDISSTVQTLASTNALVLFPFKFAVSYTILYHWLGALRHFAWDHHKIGNQVSAGASAILSPASLKIIHM